MYLLAKLFNNMCFLFHAKAFVSISKTKRAFEVKEKYDSFCFIISVF